MYVLWKYQNDFSDINDVSKSLAEDVCNKYDAKLVIIDISAAKIKSAIMGVENL